MKIIIFLLLMVPLSCLAQTEKENARNWNIGASIVHRNLNSYENLDNYNYPRLSAEYSFPKCSSVELMAERVGKIKTTNYTYPPYYPITVGYKLNILPWFTKNEWLVQNLKIYNSLRYSIIFYEGHTDHKLLYAPGIECYVYKNLGINTEFVFGQNMKTTFALGLKYRF
ncbi:hypothetical protein [Maribellus mangrovi]|uniref:hypothetical protein n=1 Tax=Maribellus mangrovi TaxID=3133146 RepID=UPI0030EF9FF2